jgi:hypothetical protein
MLILEKTRCHHVQRVEDPLDIDISRQKWIEGKSHD